MDVGRVKYGGGCDGRRHFLEATVNVPDLIDFLQELRANNSREWFDRNRPRYDGLRADFLAAVTAILDRTAAVDEGVAGLSAPDCLFRINRDIRFSKDKSPYKTTFSAMLVHGKKSTEAKPGYYVHIDADDDLIVAGGSYMPDMPSLTKFRKAIAEDVRGFRKIVEAANVKSTFGPLGGESLKTVPREYGADHPAADYLKLKGYILVSHSEASALSGDALVDFVVDRFAASTPLIRFLRAALAE